MAEKKHSILALLDILKDCSDEQHPLSLRDLQDLLISRYGLKLERRTIYANIEVLNRNGVEISTFDDNHRGYYLQSRQFDKGEVLLLCNAIHASHFISGTQSNELIDKLLATQSRYAAREFTDKVYMSNPLKTERKQLLFTIEEVSASIRDHKRICFTYLKYNPQKKLVPRRKEPYIAEPRYIVYADSRAYMIATSPHHENFVHYRLDRMKDVKVLNETSSSLPRDVDAYEYARNKLFMYGGESGFVTFDCKMSILDPMIDIFGTGLAILSYDKDQFRISVRTSRTGAIYLAQQYLDAITIVEPEDLKEEFKTVLKEANSRYLNEKENA